MPATTSTHAERLDAEEHVSDQVESGGSAEPEEQEETDSKDMTMEKRKAKMDELRRRMASLSACSGKLG
jgi:hypothetical protein